MRRGWYRFGGRAGNNMPTKCVRRNRCSTTAPAWFRGRLPSRKYQRVSGVACFHGRSGCCQWSRGVRVTNCGNYNVYYLIGTVGCNQRYCGNRHGEKTTTVLCPLPINSSLNLYERVCRRKHKAITHFDI